MNKDGGVKMVVIYNPDLKGTAVDYYMLVNKIRKWTKERKYLSSISSLGGVFDEFYTAYTGTYSTSTPSPVDQTTAKLTLSTLGDVRSLAQTIYNYTHSGPAPSGYLLERNSPNKMMVSKLQTLLKAFGYDIGPTGADGIFGPKTESAVKAFQRDNGLIADGIVGNKTSEALAAKAGSLSENGGVLSSVFETLKDLVVSILNGKTDQMKAKAKAYDLIAKNGGLLKYAQGSGQQPVYITPTYQPTTPTQHAGFLGIPTPWLIGGGLLLAGVYFIEKRSPTTKR